VVNLKFMQQFDSWKRFEQQPSGAEQAAEKLALNFSLAVLFFRLGFAWVCEVLAEMRWTGSLLWM